MHMCVNERTGVGKSFWHPGASRLEAEQMLKSKPPGSFVIRRSSKVGCLALSHKLPNHSFGHALVMFDGQGYTLEQVPLQIFVSFFFPLIFFPFSFLFRLLSTTNDTLSRRVT
jgi:hypothetical protein